MKSSMAKNLSQLPLKFMPLQLAKLSFYLWATQFAFAGHGL